MAAEKTRNGGTWTESKFTAFIRGSGLRRLTSRWGPKNAVKKAAWVERGKYRCVGYERKSHIVKCSLKVPGKRKSKNNVFVDHIIPIGPHTSWDLTIDRMFCEADNLQVLCGACHSRKSSDEKEAGKI